MELFIVRHSAAVPHGTPGVAEDDRTLTDEGIEKAEKAAKALSALGIVPNLILTSPLPRARQTAEIIKAVLGETIPLKAVAALAPTGHRSDVYEELRQHERLAGVMLVGHQPMLGEIAGEMAWGSAEHYLELKKSGACCLEVERLRPVPAGELQWVLTPAILRKLAKKGPKSPQEPKA